MNYNYVFIKFPCLLLFSIYHKTSVYAHLFINGFGNLICFKNEFYTLCNYTTAFLKNRYCQLPYTAIGDFLTFLNFEIYLRILGIQIRKWFLYTYIQDVLFYGHFWNALLNCPYEKMICHISNNLISNVL